MVHGLCAAGGGCIDEGTYVNRSSNRAALRASGAACAMVHALVAGEARVGFAAVRPAGHHAERSRAMGFCLFNNIAVAAQLAIAELGVRRVFILDWDVHYGNGTAEISTSSGPKTLATGSTTCSSSESHTAPSAPAWTGKLIV